MKKTLSILLAAILLLGAFALPFPARAADIWDAASHTFKLTTPPEILFIAQESDECGTSVTAHFRASAEVKALADLYFATAADPERMLTEQLGLDAGELHGYLWVGVQFAYSFDGAVWVNDWDEDPEALSYDQPRIFDMDEDGFEEYVDMPNTNLDPSQLINDITLFNGAGAPFYADYKDAEEARDIITKHNQAMLQGRGEYRGSYDPDGDDNRVGCMVDFNANTLYVKARYRVYTDFETEESAGGLDIETVSYSDWSGVTTFNNAKASPEAQNCVPDKNALRTNAAPTLELLAKDRYDGERNGFPVEAAFHRLVVRWPAETETALLRSAALWEEKREEYTNGEKDMPRLCFEMRVNNGPWFILKDNADPTSPYEVIDDNYYTFYQELEAAGYQPGDRVFIRAFLLGRIGVDEESIPNESEYSIYRFVLNEDDILIRTGYSNVLELNLTGKYAIYYETDGGGFANGTVQRELFDDETDVTVDLTAPDYIPVRRHFTFMGWYDNPDFTGSPVTSFRTDKKQSLTFWAKWEELPFHTLSYDLGVVTAYVHNPNETRIYPDSGENADGVLALEPVSYGGAAFLGWFSAPTGGTKIESLTFAEMAGDKTLYAHWELPVYTVTYAGAGTEYVNNEKNPASFQKDPSGETNVLLYAPARKGYIFDGWYLKKDFTGGELSYDRQADAYILDAESNVTVYAKWIRGRWNIDYVLNLTGVWNGANPAQYTYGEAVDLQAPTRTGYRFEGWFTDKALTRQIKTIPADAEGEKTLYAKWTAIPYTVTYDLRDPNAAAFLSNPNPTARTVDDEIVLKPLQAVNPVYSFLGWYDNVNFSGKPVEKIDAGTAKNVTLYAKLFKNQWGDVNFDGAVSAADARLVLRAAVKLEKLSAVACAWGDLNDHSAKHELTAADARLVLRMAVKLETVSSLGLPAYPAGV